MWVLLEQGFFFSPHLSVSLSLSLFFSLMGTLSCHHGHFSEMGCFANSPWIHWHAAHGHLLRRTAADAPPFVSGNGALLTSDGNPNAHPSDGKGSSFCKADGNPSFSKHDLAVCTIAVIPNSNSSSSSSSGSSGNDSVDGSGSSTRSPPNGHECSTDGKSHPYGRGNPSPDCNKADDKPKQNCCEDDVNRDNRCDEAHGTYHRGTKAPSEDHTSSPDVDNWEMLSFEDALACLERNGDELPSLENLICILQKCRKKRSPNHARHIYMHVLKHGMECHRVLGNHLVPMLVECGCLSEARGLFDRLLFRNEHSWTSLIQGCNDSGLSQDAFSLLGRMQESGVKPSRHTYVALLKACAKLKGLDIGRNLHTEIVKESLESDVFIGNILVDMYAKCGSLLDAQKVFDMLLVRDVVSWTALLGGYADHGLGHEALVCLEKMRSQHVDLNDVTLICGLKACASIRKLDKGQELHAEITKEGYEKNPYVFNALVDFYAKCGLLSEARLLFDDGVPHRDEVSWNSIISGYAEQGFAEEALSCFDEMRKAGMSPNVVTFLCVLKACGTIRALDKGKEIHVEIDKEGYGKDLLVCNALIDMYCQCGSVSEAQKVFDKMPVRDVISWTKLMTAFTDQGLYKDSLACLEKMRNEGIRPDPVTYLSLLKNCSTRGSIGMDIGREIHAEIDKQGYGGDIAVGNSLINMYTKCGSLKNALETFQKMPTKNVVSWTTLLSGYAEQGQGEEALKLFEQMKEEGVPPNDITFVCSLKACGSIKAIYKGRQIHCDIVIEGLEGDLFISNSLIDMYAKCGLLLEAQETIDEMPSRDVISWTSLIAGYVDSGLIVEAQSRFEQMQTECVISEVISWGPLLMGYAEKGSGDVTFELYGKMLSQGLLPNRVTFMSILKACSDEGEGKKIHAQICKSGKATDRALLNNLIDMYCRVGCIDHAQEVFDEMHTRDHVTWTALMKGYLMRKESNRVLHLFGRMILEGQQPDGITFLLVLNACRCARLVQKGRKFFEMMSKEYGINPTIEHKDCMADLLRESGKIDEAVEILL